MLLSRAKRLSPAPVFFLRLRLHLIQFMALIQCNVTLDINRASKQRTCVQLFYLLSYSGSMVVPLVNVM